MVRSGPSESIAGAIEVPSSRFGLTVVFLACGLTSSCTMIGSLDRFVPTESEHESVSIDRFEPWQHKLGGHGFRLGGTAGALRVATETHHLTIQCQEFAWDQSWFGPILPVFPVLMGAGHALKDVTFRLDLVEGSQPLSFSSSDLKLLVEGGTKSIEATSGYRVARDPNQKETSFEANKPIELQVGDCVWLYFDVPNRSISAFDLQVSIESTPLRLHFDRQRTPFLFIAP